MQTRTPPRDLEGIHKLLTERIIYGWLEDSPAVALTAAKLAELKAQIKFLAEALCDDDRALDFRDGACLLDGGGLTDLVGARSGGNVLVGSGVDLGGGHAMSSNRRSNQ